MDPKQRYEQERLELKQQREVLILASAERVFIDKGIEKTTMQNIADEANIGIATLFRYFPKKDKLIVAVAIQLVEATLERFVAIRDMPLTCLEKMKRLFDAFVAPLLDKNDQHIKFLEDFESYAAHSPEPLEGMDAYNALHRTVSKAFSSMIEEGMRDGSIRSDIDVRETLTTVVNAFVNFSRKLSLQRNIMRLETDLEPERQVAILKHILLDYLQPKGNAL